MKYYLDTEFIERSGSIKLISIGLVDESGKNKYYAISSEFNSDTASDWVKDNVIHKLEKDIIRKTEEEIKKEIISYIEYTNNCKYFEQEGKKYFAKEIKNINKDDNGFTLSYIPLEENEIEFWAYFADYDWVVFCWLFGTMMDLPKGMPMYCKDLKQEMDILDLPKELKPSQRRIDYEKSEKWIDEEVIKEEAKLILNTRFNGLTKEIFIKKKRESKKYGSFITDSHNALVDASWNRLLHRALIAYEAQKNTEKIHEEWQDLAKEMEYSVKSYETLFNSNNPEADEINLKLKLNEINLSGDPEFVGKAALTLELRQYGSARLLASKVFGFRNHNEKVAKFDWALKLYREMMYEIVGACITLQQLSFESEKRSKEQSN